VFDQADMKAGKSDMLTLFESADSQYDYAVVMITWTPSQSSTACHAYFFITV